MVGAYVFFPFDIAIRPGFLTEKADTAADPHPTGFPCAARQAS